MLSEADAARPTMPLRASGGFGVGPLRGRRLGLAAAGAALVAALVALALVLSADGGVAVSGPIAIGQPPLRIAAGGEAIWVTSEKDGTLTELDPESGEPVG